MKLNKLAAGALALALGLGAVAPAVADTAKTGTQLVTEDYNEALALANKFHAERAQARKDIEAAKVRIEAAKKAVKAAEEAYKNAPGESTKANVAKLQGEADVLKKDVETAVKAVEEARKDLKKAIDDDVKDRSAFEANVNDANGLLLATTSKYEAKLGELAAAIEKNKAEEDKVEVDNKLTPKQQALVDLVKAQNELAAANGAYGKAVSTEKAVQEKYSNKAGTGALDKLKDAARAAGAIVSIENDKVVVKPSIKGEAKKDRAELVKALEAAKTRAEVAISSAEFLLKQAPKSVAKVKDVLEKQIKDAKATIEKANKALGVKSAFIATAYADEASDADLEALTKELNKNAEDIENTIKENEKAQPEVKEENKKEDKKEDKKANKPSKKAGSNAKTGIAGVAGVAGILAAASVAYAASKRD